MHVPRSVLEVCARTIECFRLTANPSFTYQCTFELCMTSDLFSIAPYKRLFKLLNLLFPSLTEKMCKIFFCKKLFQCLVLNIYFVKVAFRLNLIYFFVGCRVASFLHLLNFLKINVECSKHLRNI